MGPAPPRLLRIAHVMVAVSGAFGAAGLVGNLFDIDPLVTWIPGRPRMQPGAAVSLMLGAFGVCLQLLALPGTARGSWRTAAAGRAVRTLSRGIGLALALFGALVASEYLFAVDLHVDWRLANAPMIGPHPGRPSPFTAVTLVCLGAGLVLFELKPRAAATLRELSFVTAILIAFVSLVGHGFAAGALYAFRGSKVIGIALPTALGLSGLGIAGWLPQVHEGLFRVAIAPGPGGVLVRRLGLTALVGGPLLGGLLLLFVEVVELDDLPLILALGTVLGVVLALLLLVMTAIPLERAAAVAELTRARATELFEQAPEGIFIADLDGRYTDVNGAGCRLLGCTRAEILGKSIVDFIPAEDVERLWRQRDELLGGSEAANEWRLRNKSGDYVPVEVTAKILPDGRWQGFVRDISERKQLERQTARSLSEKEVLLREIHHRVKNNLQVISSLFSLQRERTDSAELKGLLDESRARVQAIGLVHDQLYRSTDLAAIDYDEYLRNLTSGLRVTYGAEHVALEVNAKHVLLDIEQAVPCALLVCELVSNSLRHGVGATKVWVRARMDGEGHCVLEVGDDGRGIAEDFDWQKARSLGLRLVQSLARQLRATLELDRERGTQFTIRFAPLGLLKEAK